MYKLIISTRKFEQHIENHGTHPGSFWPKKKSSLNNGHRKFFSVSGIIYSHINTPDIDLTAIFLILNFSSGMVKYLIVMNLYFISQLLADIIRSKAFYRLLGQADDLFDHLRCPIFGKVLVNDIRTHSLIGSLKQFDFLDHYGDRVPVDDDDQ